MTIDDCINAAEQGREVYINDGNVIILDEKEND